MPLFGSKYDMSLFRKINRELISSWISQEVIYYKIALAETTTNAYGETKSATGRFYYSGILLNLLDLPEVQATNDSDAGPDEEQTAQFRFLRDDLIDINLEPAIGDIIMWRNDYFEVDNTNENQYIMGKDNNYPLSDSTKDFGSSWSIMCNTHLTRPTKLNITQERL